jgi:hypothetical protein
MQGMPFSCFFYKSISLLEVFFYLSLPKLYITEVMKTTRKYISIKIGRGLVIH